MQSLYWIILIVFILLIIFPMTINIKISYDPYKNKGVFGFQLFNLKVAFASFKFKGLGIEIKTREKKPKEVEFEASRKDVIYAQRLIAQFRDKLKVKSMVLTCKVGQDDAFRSAMLSGVINSVAYGLFAFVKNFKQTGSLSVRTKTEFNKKILKFKLNFKLSICLLDFVYCLLFAFINTRRTLKNEQISARKFHRRTFGFKY